MYIRNLIYILVLSLCSAVSAQISEVDFDANNPSLPYIAEITGDNVYVRSGPGTENYDCLKLMKGDRIKVVEVKNNWCRISPPMDSFSWISQRYVSVDPNSPNVGKVTGESVVVRAGSSDGNPLHSETEQITLNSGASVMVISKYGNDYYKIVPPDGVSLWVSNQFTRPLGKVGDVAILSYPELDVDANAVSISETNEPNAAAIPAIGENQVNVPVVPAVMVAKKMSTEAPRLVEYYKLVKKVAAEKTKPIEQQNYTEIKKGFTAIADDKLSGKAGKNAKFAIEQINRYELAGKVAADIKVQDEQYQQTVSKIDKAHKMKLAEIDTKGKYAAMGLFKVSSIYGQRRELRHYQIVDETGKVVCFALPTGPALNIDLDKFIGKKVGLAGKIEPHSATTSAIIRFSEIAVLE